MESMVMYVINTMKLLQSFRATKSWEVFRMRTILNFGGVF